MKRLLFFLFCLWASIAQSQPQKIALAEQAFRTHLESMNERFSSDIDVNRSVFLEETADTALTKRLEPLFQSLNSSDEQRQRVLHTLSRAKGVGAYRFKTPVSTVCLVHVPKNYDATKAPTAFVSAAQYHAF